MKTLLILVFVLAAGMYSYSQVVESQPVPAQQVQTPLPLSDVQNGNSSRGEEPVIENKPVRIGEAPVKITNRETKQKKEREPIKNIPVRKEEKIQAIPKK